MKVSLRTLVQLEATETVRLDRLCFMWVVWKRFAIDGSADDEAILQGLIEHAAFRGALIDFEVAARDDFEVHGPYRARDVVPGRYVATDAESARSLLRSWADGDTTGDPDDHDPQSQETHDRLEEKVFPLFQDGVVLRLASDQLEMVDGAFVGNCSGFHEFVVLNRENSTLHLIVAADD